MDASIWRMARQAFPGPVALAAWLAVTLPAPLMFFEATHRWEEQQEVSTALWWTLGALPVLAAVVAARWTRNTGQRRGVPAFLAAVGGATLISAAFLGTSMAVYRWGIPLQGTIGWWSLLLGGVALAAGGAAVGYVIGVRGPQRRHTRLADQYGYLVGGIVAVLGAFLAPVTVQLGAEDSTSEYNVSGYGGVGPYSSSASAPGTVTLPAAGRYAILAVGFSPQDPDCRITGAGLADRSAELVSIPPSGYGSDAATFSWVASFDVPASGVYSLNCRSSEEEASYLVWGTPEIRGAVGELIHWPVATIWLLGTLPGLLVIANTVRRRRIKRQKVPAPSVP
ncbi:hypothetical protein ACWDV4_00130 [Micromonospora sp. NPDC003197]